MKSKRVAQSIRNEKLQKSSTNHRNSEIKVQITKSWKSWKSKGVTNLQLITCASQKEDIKDHH